MTHRSLPRLTGLVATTARDGLLASAACVPSGGPVWARAQLSFCCGQTGPANQTSCDDILSSADDAVCQSQLESLETAGECGADASTAPCAALAACCVGMPALNASACGRTASLSDPTACEQDLTAFESRSGCNAGVVSSSRSGGKTSARGASSGSGTGTASSSTTASARDAGGPG